jgi:hypothetical protein
LLLRNRLGAVRHEQFVGGIGDIAPRVDERAIQVEDDEAEGGMGQEFRAEG